MFTDVLLLLLRSVTTQSENTYWEGETCPLEKTIFTCEYRQPLRLPEKPASINSPRHKVELQVNKHLKDFQNFQFLSRVLQFSVSQARLSESRAKQHSTAHTCLCTLFCVQSSPLHMRAFTICAWSPCLPTQVCRVSTLISCHSEFADHHHSVP